MSLICPVSARPIPATWLDGGLKRRYRGVELRNGYLN